MHIDIDSTALNHHSIRRFKDAPLDASTLRALEDVAQATASSKFLQQFTLIHITDPTLRRAIADVTTYNYVAGAGELYVFVVDQARNIALTAGSDVTPHQLLSWDGFLGGVFDVTLAAQNLVSAAEHSGLGTVYLGSILNDPARMIKLLNLPQYTFPLLAVQVGVPDEAPETKPRLPHATVVADNSYPGFDAAALAAYNTQIANYYANRSWNQKHSSFTSAMLNYMQAPVHHRDEIGAVLRQQGFAV